MADLLLPFVELKAGNNAVKNLFAGLDIWLSRKDPADIAEFAFKLGLPELSLAKDVPVEIWIGYDGNNNWKVFSGYVVEPRPPRFLCKDEAVKLFKTKITQAFNNVSPQDIIKFGLKKAGIEKYQLAEQKFPYRQRFVVAGESVSDLIKRVNATWELNFDHYFNGERTFYWDPPAPRPGPVYSYRYGENIISLEFATEREPAGQRAAGGTAGAGRLVTVASPFVGHSREIEIIWPEVPATKFFVETVHHFMSEKGSLRTEIFFRELGAA